METSLLQAVTLCAEVMRSPDSPGAVRLAAARFILELGSIT